MRGVKWKLNSSRTSATLQIRQPMTVDFSAEEIDELLQKLGHMRSLMKPSIKPKFAPGQKVKGLRNPAWMLEAELMLGHSLLHVRDNRYGWLHFAFPHGEAEKLALMMQKRAAGNRLNKNGRTAN